MIVSINQPAYLPWLGYFHRIAASDIHVILDHVQFEKNSYTNRNRIRTKDGSCWLTVPVRTKGLFGNLAINKVEIVNDISWPRKHMECLRVNYSRAPYFANHRAFFEELYDCPGSSLSEFLERSTLYLLRVLGISTPLVKSSQLDVSGIKADLILEICKEVGATTYVSGALGRNYLSDDVFYSNGIRVVYQNYRHPTYEQVFSCFEGHLSVLDLLFNHGAESLGILMNNQEVYL